MRLRTRPQVAVSSALYVSTEHTRAHATPGYASSHTSSIASLFGNESDPLDHLTTATASLCRGLGAFYSATYMGPPKQSESNAEAKAREDHNPESKAPLIDQPVAAAPTDNVVNPLGSTDDRKDRTVGSMSSPIIPAIGPNSKANAQNSKTWRGGGTWRRGGKATPVTEVAKESILAATDKASEVFSSAGNTAAHIGVKRTASPSIYLSRSLRGSNRSLPTFASATKVSATSDSLASPVGSFQQSAMSGTALAQGRDSTVERLDTGEKRKRDPEPQPHPPDDRTPPKRDEQEGRAENEALTWRGWFLRTGEPTKAELSKPADTTDDPTPKPANQTRRRNSDPSATTTNGKEEHLPRSWLGLWAATRSAKAESADGATLTVVESPTKPSSSSRAVTPNTEDAHVAQGPQGTFTNNYPGWAFWSRQPPGKTVGDVDPSNQGELVLAESSINVSSTPPVSDATKGVSDKKPRLVGSVCKDQTPQAQAQAETLSSPTKKLKTTSEIEPLQESNTSISSTNLLLPPIVATYRPAPRQSWLEALSQWWQDDRSSKTNRVQLLPKPPRIKKALAIVRTACLYVCNSHCSSRSPKLSRNGETVLCHPAFVQ